MKMKMIAGTLILIGIMILVFPKASELYYDYQQQKLVKEWQNSLLQIDNGDDHVDNDAQDTGQSSAMGTDELTRTTSEIEATPTAKPDFSSYKNMEGILSIEKIDLMLPILHGATDINMKTTVASIENTGKAGELGNYAIAGHRNFTYGRNFNRLDEMEVGDKIDVDNGDHQFTYTVTEKLYVKPEEVWVLEGNKKDKEITLVTCHPMVDPTHRLIVKGKIID
ncbi:class D sortase [Paenibacillus albiflavus]|uniref:Class D sortase n=1 Tax=Paenibacillus albiflavus TaxID=2545760 RepID=A0A4R4EEJ3_9BACL|nr:class D sortase [Paenibacillus albiflavus]TCZ76591.1 class D sortase [Paenibacillus albiflavus]